jgi:hypothetical protein
MVGVDMPSFRDYLNIENPNELSDRMLRKAVSVMSSAANKRLQRLEKNDIYFGSDFGENTTSGVKRFGVKGKSTEEVKREFKRVRNYLSNEQSSFTGMYRVYTEFKKEVIKGMQQKQGKEFSNKDEKDYRKMRRQKASASLLTERKLTKAEELQAWRDVWDFYDAMKEVGEYLPTSYDSKQTRDYMLNVIQDNMLASDDNKLTDDEMYEIFLEYVRDSYEKKKEKEKQEEEKDISTSSLVEYDYGESD